MIVAKRQAFFCTFFGATSNTNKMPPPRWIQAFCLLLLTTHSTGLPVRCPQDQREILLLRQNTSYTVRDSSTDNPWSGNHARAAIEWPKINHTANVHVMAELVTPDEAKNIITLLEDEEFDVDKDTVDKMTTFEFYLQKNGNFDDLASIPGKPALANERLHVRQQLTAITAPIIEERIIPIVNDLYSDHCQGNCRPCFSFVRRYDSEHRTTHQTHLDIQALVTVVVSLNSFGVDFDGGLFVSTGNSHDTIKYLGLQSGDAVIHQADLLHGVRVPSGQRWSWILW